MGLIQCAKQGQLQRARDKSVPQAGQSLAVQKQDQATSSVSAVPFVSSSLSLSYFSPSLSLQSYLYVFTCFCTSQKQSTYLSLFPTLPASVPNSVCVSPLFCLLLPNSVSMFHNSISPSFFLSTSISKSVSFFSQLYLFLLKLFLFAMSLLSLNLAPSVFCSLSSSLYFCPLVAGKARKNSTLKTSPGTAPGTVSSAAPVLPNSVASNPRNALRFVLSLSCKCHDPPTCPPYLPYSRPALVTRLSLSRLSLLSLASRRSTNVDRASSQVTRRPVTPVLSVNPDVPAAVPMPRTPMRLRSKVSLTARAVQDIVKRNQRL